MRALRMGLWYLFPFAFCILTPTQNSIMTCQGNEATDHGSFIKL